MPVKVCNEVIGAVGVGGAPGGNLDEQCALVALDKVKALLNQAAAYTGLHAAAQKGDVANIDKLAAAKADLNARDANGRTPLHVASFAKQRDAIRALGKTGADINLLDKDRYDGVVKTTDRRRRAAGPYDHPALDGGD